MGIRFTCPAGHQLNVKSELAGKRGVCPQCGAKVQIPNAIPQPLQVGTVETEVEPPLAATEPEAAKPQGMAELIPAMDEAWYVRPPGGGQFGPANPVQFVQWLREGRVVPEAHVWRAGWPDWRRASEAAADLPAALPTLTPPAAELPSAEPLAGPPVIPAVVPDELPRIPRPAARRKRSAKRQFTVAILLLTVALILGAILIWVLQREPSATAQVPRMPAGIQSATMIVAVTSYQIRQ